MIPKEEDKITRRLDEIERKKVENKKRKAKQVKRKDTKKEEWKRKNKMIVEDHWGMLRWLHLYKEENKIDWEKRRMREKEEVDEEYEKWKGMEEEDMIRILMNMEEEIFKLEIPTTLYTDIRTEYKDDWRMRTIDTSHMKRKVAEVLSNRFKSMRDCPYCGRANFKKLMSHILRNSDCHLQYKVQLEYDFVQNSCFW